MDFQSVYQNYFKDVYIFLLGLSSNPDIAQEITQETFVKALHAINRFDGSKDIRAWLFTIARNTFYSEQKKRSRFSKQELCEAITADDDSVEEALANADYAFQIHRFLHTMKEPYKEVFSLRVFGELSFEKIGMLFGKSPSWARVTYYRAKKQIQTYMEVVNREQGDL